VDFLRGLLDMRGSNPELVVFTTYFGEAHGTTTNNMVLHGHEGVGAYKHGSKHD
jgi:hypothetical protein